MKTAKNLRLRLRLIEGVLVLLLGLFTAGAAATRQLLLDAANKPVADISLSSSHWTGTLDAARLPAVAVRLDENNDLTLPKSLFVSDNLYAINCIVHGALDTDAGSIHSDGLGDLTVGGAVTAAGVLNADFGMNVLGIVFMDDTATIYYPSGNPITDVYGRLYYSNGYTLADTDGTLYAANWVVMDAGGFLHTGCQSYQDGAVAPTGFIIVKDATGTSYCVPAAPAP